MFKDYYNFVAVNDEETNVIPFLYFICLWFNVIFLKLVL